MTQPTQKQYTMYRGDTLVLKSTITQNGAPIDLTGAKVWFTAKREVADADVDAVIQVMTPTDIAIDPDQVRNRGQIIITVPASVTAVLAEASLRLFYDIQVKISTGRVATVEAGVLNVVTDVTQAIA